MSCSIHIRLLFRLLHLRPLVATSFRFARSRTLSPSRYSVFPPHVCTCTYDPLHATLVSRPHELKLSPSSFVHGGDERRPYVPLVYRYALVVVFNEYAFYKSVRSTTTATATTAAMVVAGGRGVTTTATATAMMTAAWSSLTSEFTDFLTTARINMLRLAFFQAEIDSEGNTGRCKLVYPIMNVFLHFTFTTLTIRTYDSMYNLYRL